MDIDRDILKKSCKIFRLNKVDYLQNRRIHDKQAKNILDEKNNKL